MHGNNKTLSESFNIDQEIKIGCAMSWFFNVYMSQCIGTYVVKLEM